MSESEKIVVLGSLNMDLVVRTQRAPGGGETLAGQDFNTYPGGKGANQAVAVSRLGGRVTMVGRVGQDAFGSQMVSNLEKNGVDTGRVRFEPDESTGVALIVVEASGENRIIIVAGANGRVSQEDVDAAALLIQNSRLLVMQFEIGRNVVKYAADLAHQHAIPVLLNPSPPYPIEDDLMRNVTWLVLNEHEAEVISGIPVNNPDSAKAAAQLLAKRGVKGVILTLGAQGAVMVNAEKTYCVPAFRVHAIDTTAAGDAFIGGFAAALGRSIEMEEKVRFASAAGALAVTRMGAQSSLPSLTEVEAFLLSHLSNPGHA